MTTKTRMRLRGTSRIVKAADFDRCHKKGKRFASQQFVVLHFQKMEGPTRLGVAVSKKTGNAIVRNRWKRIIRDTFRTERDRLPQNGDDVVIVKKSTKGKPSSEAKKELLSLFARVAAA